MFPKSITFESSGAGVTFDVTLTNNGSIPLSIQLASNISAEFLISLNANGTEKDMTSGNCISVFLTNSR